MRSLRAIGLPPNLFQGYTHESERQFFLVCDMGVHLLKEIAELLQAAQGRIPIVHPYPRNEKAEVLLPEPYFFQWSASADGWLGHFDTRDVRALLRLLFHSLVLTTRAGEPIRIAPHLLRHVLSPPSTKGAEYPGGSGRVSLAPSSDADGLDSRPHHSRSRGLLQSLAG